MIPSTVPPSAEQLRPSRLPMPEADMDLADLFVEMARAGFPIGLPLATWNPRDLTVTVREGSVVSVWTATAVYVDGRPGGHVGYELVETDCISVTPDNTEPSEEAEDVAHLMLEEYADQIGGAR